MELHERLRRLARDFGVEIFNDGDTLRGAVDDYVPEDEATNGEINLLVDAIRLGAIQRMVSILDADGSPESAVEGAGDLLARERGTADVAGSRWACAVLGFALGRVDESKIRRYRTSPSSPPPVLGAELDPPPTAPAPPAPEWPAERQNLAAAAGATPEPRPAPSPADTAGLAATYDGERTASSQALPETGVPTPHPPVTPPTAPAPGNRAGQPAGSDPFLGVPPEPRDRHTKTIVAGVCAIVLLIAGVVFALTQGNSEGDNTASGGRSTATTPSTTPETTTPETTDSGQTTGDGKPPGPFQSAAMYQMARYLFDPAQCSRIHAEADAPLAWVLDPQPEEMMKCETDDQAFAAVFLCNHTTPVGYIREAYLAHAIPGTEETVAAPPAGWDKRIDGIEVAFKHESGGDARVYWDSTSQLCTAELQSSTRSLDATVQFWLRGN